MTEQTASRDQPGRELFCSYEAGMFFCERHPDLEHPISGIVIRKRTTALHEAGHAVAQYALGLGCSQISLTTTQGEDTFSCGGECRRNRSTHQRIARRVCQGRFDAGVLALGVTIAAGPAAERKYCLENGLPLSAGTEGDHRNIEAIGAWLGNRSPAFQRLAWRRAQLVMENEIIWGAVNYLGAELEFWWEASASFEIGTETFVMHGTRARSIMRKSGIVPGMFGLVAQ